MTFQQQVLLFYVITGITLLVILIVIWDTWRCKRCGKFTFRSHDIFASNRSSRLPRLCYGCAHLVGDEKGDKIATGEISTMEGFRIIWRGLKRIWSKLS
jgi:hypothetical protein